MKKRILSFIVFACVMAIGLLSAPANDSENKESSSGNSTSEINPLFDYDKFY